ncbi:MAG: dihydroorotase [Thermodesulfobacteriota bacterium]|nr:dihydroorotase [Thermodesulfobacteriota bacterium]
MWIKGADILDPAVKKRFIGDIHVVQDRIKGVYPLGDHSRDEKAWAEKVPGEEVIDAQGLLAMPGMIDMHVHFREPGFEYKEDILSGSMAAVAGGITAVACMANTSPVNDDPAITRFILDKADQAGLIRVFPVGAVTKGLEGKDLAEMGRMRQAGIVAVSDDGMPVQDAVMLRRALEYASTFGLMLISHAQDMGLSGKGVMNEGALSAALGLEGIPWAAEDVMVARDIMVAEYTGLSIHITHLSTRGSIELVRQAKARGVKVTCDVTPHHLLLTEAMVKGYNTNAKMYPPLRREDDRLALIEGFRQGIIDCIVTDHAPHSYDEKALDFDLAPFGVIGLQTLLPALIRLHLDHGIDLMRLVDSVSVTPAGILGIEGGSLCPGARADITLVDTKDKWVLKPENIRSKAHNSAFLNQTMTGSALYTIVAGQVVYKNEN